MKNDDSHKSPRKNFAIRDASDPSPASSDVEAPELQAIGDQLLREARDLSSRYPATTVASAHKSHDPDSGHSVSWQQLWRVAACLFIVAGSAAAWISWQNSMNRGAPETPSSAELVASKAAAKTADSATALSTDITQREPWETALLSSPELEGLLDLIEESTTEVQRLSF